MDNKNERLSKEEFEALCKDKMNRIIRSRQDHERKMDLFRITLESNERIEKIKRDKCAQETYKGVISIVFALTILSIIFMMIFAI